MQKGLPVPLGDESDVHGVVPTLADDFARTLRAFFHNPAVAAGIADVDVVAAKGTSDPGLTKADGTGFAGVPSANWKPDAAKGKSDPGLTAKCKGILPPTAKRKGILLPPTPKCKVILPPTTKGLVPQQPPRPPPLWTPPLKNPLWIPRRPSAISSSTSSSSSGIKNPLRTPPRAPPKHMPTKRAASPVGPGYSAKHRCMDGREPPGDAAHVRQKSWEAHVHLQDCVAVTTVARSYRPCHGQQGSSCKYRNEFAKDCDYNICGKCCRGQPQGTWCKSHRYAKGDC